MAIVISGYTAAGKTTQCRLLAAELGFEFVWAAGQLLVELGYSDIESRESELWYDHIDEINDRRRHSDADAIVDALLTEYSARSGVVIDSRFLPWIKGRRPVVAVWLESDLLSRSRKCQRSLQNTSSNPSLLECAVSLHDKDGGDVRRVAEVYGAVFCGDDDTFDLVIDVSPFATAASFADGSGAVALCNSFIAAAVRWRLGDQAAAVDLLQHQPDLAGRVYAAIPELVSQLPRVGA